MDDLLNPLRMQLAPHLSDAVVIGAIGGASKRMESAIRRVSIYWFVCSF